MVEYYTIKQVGSLRIQTNHRFYRVLVADDILMDNTDDYQTIMQLIRDWHTMEENETLRFSMMTRIARQFNVVYETIYRAFYQQIIKC